MVHGLHWIIVWVCKLWKFNCDLARYSFTVIFQYVTKFWFPRSSNCYDKFCQIIQYHKPFTYANGHQFLRLKFTVEIFIANYIPYLWQLSLYRQPEKIKQFDCSTTACFQALVILKRIDKWKPLFHVHTYCKIFNV